MNKRAPEMWEQITQHVDFTGKSVVDLGCGTGDFLLASLRSGAAWAMGIELDPLTARTAKETCKAGGHTAMVLVEDIEAMPPDSEYDIGLCFSVLPYMKNPVKVLKWMHDCCGTSIIEMQYAGDGPGPQAITDDLDMLNFLSMFWAKPAVIGRTEVRGRNKWRTIWLLES